MKAKVLVVDDEKDIRELINFYLNKEGFEVLEASNGEEALEIFENEYRPIYFLKMAGDIF